jgi:hypothetical protein
MNNEKLSRVEFYDLVWSESFLTISKKYKIAYDGIRSICRQYDIPFPQTGYWGMKSDKQSDLKVDLPLDYSGRNEITLTLREDDDGGILPTGSPRKALIEAIKEDGTLQLEVPKRLTNPDPLVISAQQNLAEKAKNRYHYRGMIHTDMGQLQIRVSQALVSRALRFMDAFIKLLRSRGHSIRIQYDDTYAVIAGEEFKIKLMETHRRVKTDDRYGSSEYLPTGLLAFKMIDYHGQEWTDGKKLIEDKLAEILAKLELEAQREKEQRAAYAEERKKREERERIEREEWERQEKDEADFHDLLKNAIQWQRAMILRNYITAVEEKASKDGVLTDELIKWLGWAKGRAERYDPLNIY